MKEIYSKDLKEKKKFRRVGYDYSNIYLNNTTHCGVWELSREGKIYGYEVVKGRKYKNPDGNIVYTYPSDEDFGAYGWYICGKDALIKSMRKVKDIETSVYSPRVGPRIDL